jgi:hypothetical protein
MRLSNWRQFTWKTLPEVPPVAVGLIFPIILPIRKEQARTFQGGNPMRGSMWLLALACGLMLSASGCCGYSQYGGCGGDMCGACDGGCGPVRARHPVRQATCGDECGQSCNECDSCGDCCERNFCFHPLRWLGRLAWTGTWCGQRCGDCGESCDSCDSCCDGAPAGHGGYSTGYSTGRSGCKNCNRGGPAYDNEMSSAPDGEVIQDGAAQEPTPAPPPKTSRRTSRPAPAYN